MKQDVIKYLNETFVDFEGKKHIITLCALSQTPSDDICTFVAGWETPDKTMALDDPDYTPINRVLSIGVSICSPEDTFNEEYGKKQAYSRALNNPKCSRYFCRNSGDISNELVEGVFKQEIKRICENPETVIKGYNARKTKYEHRESLKEAINNLTSDEKIALELFKKDINLVKCAKLFKEAINAKIEI